MNFEKEKNYQKKINSYKKLYKVTGNNKLLEKVNKYMNKLKGGMGRHIDIRPLTDVEISDLYEKLPPIYEQLDGQNLIMGISLALSIKQNILEDEFKLNDLGYNVRIIIEKILKKQSIKKELEKLFIFLNDNKQTHEDYIRDQHIFIDKIEEDILNILFFIDISKDFEKVVIPSLGIELGNLFTRRIPIRLTDIRILIGKSILPEISIDIQQQLGDIFLSVDFDLDRLMSEEYIEENISDEQLSSFGSKIFILYNEFFNFNIIIRDNSITAAYIMIANLIIKFLSSLSPNVKISLQNERIGYNLNQVIIDSINQIKSIYSKKSANAAGAAVPLQVPLALAVRNQEVQEENVNEDVDAQPEIICPRVLQKIDLVAGILPKTFVIIDASGSQKTTGAANFDVDPNGVFEYFYDITNNPVLQFMKDLNNKQDVSFHKFGGVPDNIPTDDVLYKGVERISRLENGWFNPIVNMDNTFFNHVSTDTVMIKNALETLPQGIPIHLIFECDGIFRSGTVPLARILHECTGKLQNIKKVTLIFSPWTLPAQIEILTREIKYVVNTIASSIKFESKLLPKANERNVLTIPQAEKDAYNMQISGITRDIYARGKTSTIVLPPSFYSFESFMIHRDLTPDSIVKLLNIIEPREKINFINEMINLLINTIMTNPILLNIEGNIYQTLHSIARLIQNHNFTPEQNILLTIARFAEEDGQTFKISKAYFNWLSAYNDQRNDDEIRKLINESKISKQEVKYTEFILRKNCIGYFYFRNNRDVGNITIERIGAALNRPERSDTFNLFNLLIQELFFVPKTDGMVVNPGFFICPEDNNPSLVSLCLSSFFMPFKYSSLNNLIYSQLAMYTYSTDKLIVNVPFMRICVKYCLNLLNDDNLFKYITGYDTSNPNNFSNIRDIWYIYHNSQLLYRFLILIPQVYKEKFNKLTEYFSKVHRLNNIY